ncbi:hypothetical protein [Nocardia sp. NPDC050793]|uniref:hypothetical protein n=1 Tax=Nocardia sp. NPDC050793 TaxID=3155159 RepID=UPI0033FA86D0
MSGAVRDLVGAHCAPRRSEVDMTEGWPSSIGSFDGIVQRFFGSGGAQPGPAGRAATSETPTLDEYSRDLTSRGQTVEAEVRAVVPSVRYYRDAYPESVGEAVETAGGVGYWANTSGRWRT